MEDRLLLGHVQGQVHRPRAFGAGVSAKTKAAIAAKRAAITKGSFYEFQGPIYDQAGKLRVPKGKKLSLGDILGDELARQGRHRLPEGLIVLP